MRIHVLIGLLAITGTAIAGMRRPSKAALKAVEDALAGRTKAVDNELEPANRVIVDIETRVGLRNPDGSRARPQISNPAYESISPDEILKQMTVRDTFDRNVARTFERLGAGEKERYASATRDYLQAQQEVRKHSTQAIQRAVEAYGLDPLLEGTIVNGPPSGKPFGFPSYIGHAAKGGPTYAETVTDDYGRTSQDGHVMIGPRAFASARFLGATVYHEGLHHRDYLIRGIDLRNKLENEARTLAAVEPLLGKVFGWQPVEIKKHHIRLQETRQLAAQAQAIIDNGLDPWDKRYAKDFPDEPSISNLPEFHFANLGLILVEAEDERRDSLDVVASSLDDSQPAAEAVAGTLANKDERPAATEAAETNTQAADAARDLRWDALHEWVETACKYIRPVEFVSNGAGSTDGDYIRWASAENDRRASAKASSDTSGRQYMLGHSIVLPRDEIETGMKSHKSSIDSCEQDILKLLLKAPAPIQTEWLVAAIDDKKGGGSLGKVVRGIAKGIKKGSAVLVTGISVPLIAVGQAIQDAAKASERASTQAQSSEPERPSRPDRPGCPEPRGSGGAWNGSYAYGQLSGVASGQLMQ